MPELGYHPSIYEYLSAVVFIHERKKPGTLELERFHSDLKLKLSRAGLSIRCHPEASCDVL